MADQGKTAAWDEYIASAYKLGYTHETLHAYLVQAGYAPELVETILEQYDQRMHASRRNAIGASAFIMLLGAVLVLSSMQPGLLGLATFETADGTVNFASIERAVPGGYYGAVTSGITGNQSRIDTNKDRVPDTASDYQLHRRKILEAGVTHIRMDMDITNVYNRDGTFNKWNSCNTCNFDNHKSTVTWARQNNITIRLVAAYMPTWLANVTPACSANPTRCEPNNYTIWKQAVVKYIEEVGCTVPGTKCVIEAWNEPYLGQFLLPGGTCQQRTEAYFRLYDNTRAAVKSRWPNMVVGGPVGFRDTTCSRQLTESFFRNYTQAQVDEFILHQYSSSGNVDLATKLRTDIAWIRAAGHKQPLCFTEYNMNNDYVSVNEPTKHYVILAEAMMEGLRADNISCLVLFEWSITTQYGSHIGYPYPAHYIMFSEPLLDNEERASFKASRDFSAQHPGGTSVVTTTKTNTNLAVFATTGNNGKRITVANRASGANSFTIAIADRSSGTLRNTQTGATVAVSAGVAALPSIPGYGVAYYEYTPATQPVVVPPTTPAAPNLTGATIAAGVASVLPTASITCDVTGIRTNGVSGTLTATWLVNGTSINTTNRTVTTSTTESFNPPRARVPGERWSCSARLVTAGGTATVQSTETLIITPPDTTNPWVQGIFPASGNNTTNTTVQFAWRTTDETSTTISCEIIVSDVIRTTVVSANNTNTTTLLSVTPGSYDWYARCTDQAGNMGSSSRRSFRVLTTPVTPPVVPPVQNTTNNTNSTPVNSTPTNSTPRNSTNSTNSTVPVITPVIPPPPTAVLTVAGGTRRGDDIVWTVTAGSNAELQRIILSQTTPLGTVELSRTVYTNEGIESATLNIPATVTVGVGNRTCGVLSVTDSANQTTNTSKCFTSTNALPRVAVPTLEGATGDITEGRELYCLVTVEDLDNTPLAVTITTTRNAATWNSTNRTLYSGDVVRETIPSYAVVASDVWSCTVSVSDGVASDTETSSSETVIPEPEPTKPRSSGRSNSGGGGGGGSSIPRATIGGGATVTPPKATGTASGSSGTGTTTVTDSTAPALHTGADTDLALEDDAAIRNPELEPPSLEGPQPLEIDRTRQLTGYIGVLLFVIGAVGVTIAVRKHTAPKRPVLSNPQA